MKIYKFLQHGKWPVLIMAKTEAKAKYQLYRFARRHMSYDGYDGFLDCMKDFKFCPGTISYEEAQKLIEAGDCYADFEVHLIEIERAGE